MLQQLELWGQFTDRRLNGTGAILVAVVKRQICVPSVIETYERRLISNAHSEISRKRHHVFKQTKAGSKVQYFSYKLTYLFFDIVALSFNTFFPT
jgi:hypothetical protein